MYVPFFLAAIATSQTATTDTASEYKSAVLLFVQAGGNSCHLCFLRNGLEKNSMNDKLV